MTQFNYTKEILNIKDENIFFDNNFYREEVINDKTSKIFHGYLVNNPNNCPICGCINNGTDDIIKWNWKRNCLIKIPNVSNYTTYLELDKQRFFCKHCHKTFTSNTTIVDKRKQISNNTKTNIILELMKSGTEKDIAYRNNVSHNTVNRIHDSLFNDTLLKRNGILPESFGIDEFTATKDTKGKYAFIIVDHAKKELFDILDSRESKNIYTYFIRYPYQERLKVKYITMDLYKPYYSLMHHLFPNAKLIPDRFHFVIQARNALDLTRIKSISKSNPLYNKYKKYWKLLLKNKFELDDSKPFYSPNFKKNVTQKYIVTFLVNSNEEINYAYNYYQGIINSIKEKDKNKFLNIIKHFDYSKASKYLKKANNTFTNMVKYLVNSFDYELSNGIVEGINNVIKRLKHNACGYKKFKHFKTRIMLIKGIINPLKA